MNSIKHTNILVISDNSFLIKAFAGLIDLFPQVRVNYTCTRGNAALLNDTSLPVKIEPVDVKAEEEELAKRYDLIFSLHCKQLFPGNLVKKVKCINVHPGYNPYNRGWFPQVFSILNKLPTGATIHEIDEELDHGSIIARKEVESHSWDTSINIYDRVQAAEVVLLAENLETILFGSYNTSKPEVEGNINLKKDFNELCKLDLNEKTTMGKALDKLRALTHGEYANAYYIDPETNSKVYVKIILEKK